MKKLVLAVALSVNLALGEMLSRDTIANIEAICEQGGVPKICESIGHSYYFGKDVLEQNYSKARYYYEKACTKNNVKKDKTLSGVCFKLGFMHETGEGGAQNPKKAFQYFNIACDAGFGMACTHIGSMYQQGNGVEQSQAKAAKYFKSSCDKGEFTGCALLGNLNYNMQNYYEAKKYFGKACELGKKNTPSDPNLKGAWSVACNMYERLK